MRNYLEPQNPQNHRVGEYKQISPSWCFHFFKSLHPYTPILTNIFSKGLKPPKKVVSPFQGWKFRDQLVWQVWHGETVTVLPNKNAFKRLGHWVVVSNVVIFHPEIWGNDPIWPAYFSDELKPPTRRRLEASKNGLLDIIWRFHQLRWWKLTAKLSKAWFSVVSFFFASGTPWVCGHWKPCIRNGLHKLFITWVCMGLSQVFASKFQYQSKAMMILSYLSKRVSDTWAAPCSKNWCRERSFHGRHPKKKQHLDARSSEVHAILLMLRSRNSRYIYICIHIYTYIYINPPFMDVA